jgi:hypothetical protein
MKPLLCLCLILLAVLPGCAVYTPAYGYSQGSYYPSYGYGYGYGYRAYPYSGYGVGPPAVGYGWRPGWGHHHHHGWRGFGGRPHRHW